MSIPPVTIGVLIITGVMTVLAFRRGDLLERWLFNPEAILRDKQYERMLTSGFIHGDWFHFGFNAFSFFSFGRSIEFMYGGAVLLAIHLAAILGGSMLSLLIHRHHADYRALGASGGVCGVIFATIFLLPGSGVRPLLFPIAIPAYVYAVVFLLVSYFGHRRQLGNVGHDAHLGGAMVGLLVATGLYPRMVLAQPGMFATVVLLSAVILVLLIVNPHQFFVRRSDSHDVGLGGDRAQRYAENRQRNRKLAEIDELLEKISKEGIHRLSARERQRLEELSKDVHGPSRAE